MSTSPVVLNACETCPHALKEERKPCIRKFLPPVFNAQLRFSAFSCRVLPLFQRFRVHCSCHLQGEWSERMVGLFFSKLSFYPQGPCRHTAPTKTFLTLRDVRVYRPMSPCIWVAPLNFTNTCPHTEQHTRFISFGQKMAAAMSPKHWNNFNARHGWTLKIISVGKQTDPECMWT